jgi:transposase-like protein
MVCLSTKTSSQRYPLSLTTQNATVVLGRPKASSAKVQHALDLLASGKSYRHASSIAGVSLATLVRRVQTMQQKNQFTRQTSIFETLK